MSLDRRICPCGKCGVDPATWACVAAVNVARPCGPACVTCMDEKTDAEYQRLARAEALAEQGFYVTVYVEGPATQEAADEVVGQMLDVALPGTPEGTTASVVPD